jgi:hypothetical protein
VLVSMALLLVCQAIWHRPPSTMDWKLIFWLAVVVLGLIATCLRQARVLQFLGGLVLLWVAWHVTQVCAALHGMAAT